MIAQLQTIVGTDEGGRAPGNCMQAAVASLLELPLELVPHFMLFGDHWDQAVKFWLRSRGKMLRVYDDREHSRRWWRSVGVAVSPLSYAPSGQMMLAIGASPSHPGWQHMVVWKAGEVVHDPNPSGLGLDGAPWSLWQITDGPGAMV